MHNQEYVWREQAVTEWSEGIRANGEGKRKLANEALPVARAKFYRGKTRNEVLPKV